MANFKRKKSKRSVRCTLCTPLRWLGNNTGRKPLELSRRRDQHKVRAAMLREAFEKDA
jgi:hypothetical protein